MTALPNPKLNRLPSVLPPAEQERIVPQLTWADLPLGRVVYESGDRPEYVYFPVTFIVSLFHIMENGSSGEIAIVGNEGMVGITIFVGGEIIPSRTVTQSAGGAYRLSAHVLEQEFARADAMQRLSLCYTQVSITQVVQTVVCNQHHSIGQQLCRQLLLSLDRLSSNELHITQELITNMLGMRKSGVTEAALKLQTTGLVRCNHGTIEVLDHPSLERRVYECYAVVKRELDRLPPDLEAP